MDGQGGNTEDGASNIDKAVLQMALLVRHIINDHQNLRVLGYNTAGHGEVPVEPRMPQTATVELDTCTKSHKMAEKSQHTN